MAAKKKKKKARKKATRKKAKASRENGKKGGRPKFELDESQWRMFDAMCAAGALEVDIAEAFGVDRKTINTCVKRDRGLGFSAYREQKKGRGRAALAAKQYEMAMNGNTAMAIFLGKNWLGQSDRMRSESTVKSSSTVIYLPDNKRK